MKKIIKILSVLLIMVLVITSIIFSNPLRRPAEWIRHDILKLTPIGTNIEDTIKVIESVEAEREWEIWSISDKYGYRSEKGYRVGEKSIEVLAGEYVLHPLATSSVSIYWGFDRDSKLIDVYVKKEIDSL